MHEDTKARFFDMVVAQITLGRSPSQQQQLSPQSVRMVL